MDSQQKIWNSQLLFIFYLLLPTAIEFSLGGSSPYTNWDKE
jgi:hypothetical protein